MKAWGRGAGRFRVILFFVSYQYILWYEYHTHPYLFMDLASMFASPPCGLGAGGAQVSKTCKLPALGSDSYGLGSHPGQLCPKGYALSTSLPCLPPGGAREGRTQAADFVSPLQPKHKDLSIKKREGRRKQGSDLDPDIYGHREQPPTQGNILSSQV